MVIENDEKDHIKLLKLNFLKLINEKFFSSIQTIHYAATFLNTRYKSLKFLIEHEKQQMMKIYHMFPMKSLKTTLIRIKSELKKKKLPSQSRRKPKIIFFVSLWSQAMKKR